jgi:hypothetical protein
MTPKYPMTTFTFDLDSTTSFICPQCKLGRLISKEENFKVSSYVNYNRQVQYDMDYEPSWNKYAFAGYLLCNNDKCKEQIAVAGTLTWDQITVQAGADLNDVELETYQTCTPEYFERPPDIIHLEDFVPKEIRELLRSSFKLFWIDEQSCANRIRMSIEQILDFFDVKKYPQKGRRVPLPLQTRIGFFAKKHQSVAEKLTAVKWIGNAGSHLGSLKKGDLIDGYRIIQYSMRQLFSHEEKEVDRIARTINRRKRPRSHK